MSEKDLTPELIAKFVKFLKWVKAHPRGTWQDDPEIYAIYQVWITIIRDDLNLLDGKGTMRDVDGLSSYGELFLMKYCQEAKPARRRGRPRDPSIDRKQDERIRNARETGNYPKDKELAQAFNLTVPEVRRALDRDRKRAKSEEESKSEVEL
jgi:hypothetical protein